MVYRGEEFFPFPLSLFNFAGGEGGIMLGCIRSAVRMRTPQSDGARSPHLTWVLIPQSSHSRTGFHPSRFAQTSHFALSSVLEKNSSNGLQMASVDREGDVDERETVDHGYRP